MNTRWVDSEDKDGRMHELVLEGSPTEDSCILIGIYDYSDAENVRVVTERGRWNYSAYFSKTADIAQLKAFAESSVLILGMTPEDEEEKRFEKLAELAGANNVSFGT